MVALAGVRRRLHLAKQRVHLLGFQPPPGAHRAVAGHGGGDVHQPALQGKRLVPFGQMLGEVASQRRGVNLAQHRRCLADGDGAGAERLDGEAKALELVGARQQALDIGGVELDDFRDEQDLPGDALLVDSGLHALVNQPLVRRVLVDDDEAVAGLRHDVSVVHLGPGGAERTIQQVGRGLGHFNAGGRRGTADIEHGLGGFGKTGIG